MYSQETIIRGRKFLHALKISPARVSAGPMLFHEADALAQYLKGKSPGGRLYVCAKGNAGYSVEWRRNRTPKRDTSAISAVHAEVNWAKIKQAVDVFKKTGKATKVVLGCSEPAGVLVVQWLDKRGIPHGGGTAGLREPFYITVGSEAVFYSPPEQAALAQSIKKAADQIKGGAVPTRENPIRLHFRRMSHAAWVLRRLHADFKIEADMQRTRTGWSLKVWVPQPTDALVDLMDRKAPWSEKTEVRGDFVLNPPNNSLRELMRQERVLGLGEASLPKLKGFVAPLHETPAAYMYLGREGAPEVLPHAWWKNALYKGEPVREAATETQATGKPFKALQDWVDAMIYGFGVNRYSGLPKSSIEALDLSKVVQRNAFTELRQNQPVKEPEKPKAGFGQIVDAFAKHGWTFTFSGGWERHEPGYYMVRWSLELGGDYVGSGKVFAAGDSGARAEALQKAARQAALAAIGDEADTNFAREMRGRV